MVLGMSNVAEYSLGHARQDDDLEAAEESLAACFARVAATFPDNLALVSDDWRFTYAELNEAANRLAHALCNLGGRQGDRVAVLMQQDGPMIAAIVAILKAARVVVVLNKTHPPDRLRQLLDDAEPFAIVTDLIGETLANSIAPLNCAIIRCEDHLFGIARPALDLPVAPDETAFLVYTSGTTGRPKGVMKTHRMYRRAAIAYGDVMQFGGNDRIALLGSPSGGQGSVAIWCALSHGAALCPFPVAEKGVTGLAAWLVKHDITVYMSSSSIFRNFMRTMDASIVFERMRVVRLGSEPATAQDIRLSQRHFPSHCLFVHSLSSSEAGNIACFSQPLSEPVAEGRLPVGKIQRGVALLLIGDDGREVPTGDAGEIVLRSRYLAAGYWRDEALTARRFKREQEGDDRRLFLTGDAGRFNSDGLLEVLGRNDGQIKIRGNRIEVSEVADTLQRLPQVEQVALCADQPGDDAQLLAYVIARRGHACSRKMLRDAVRAALPEHMVPSAFVFLNRFPLTSHGKIDYDALRRHHPPAPVRHRSDRPSTPTEQTVGRIWGEAFELADIGPDDDFFDLGGDSLIAAVISARIYDAFGVEIDLASYLKHAALTEMASFVEQCIGQQDRRESEPLKPVKRNGARLSFFQERIWRYSQTPQTSASNNVVKSSRILGPLDRDLLRRCMKEMAQRHETLRMSVAVVKRQPVQVIHPNAHDGMHFVDLAGHSQAEEEAQRLFAREARLAIDLSRPPLYRFVLVRIRQNEHWLLRVMHHILSDARSMQLYFHELARLYEAELQGRPPPKPALLQYGDYAVWQRRLMDPARPAYRSTLAWWRDVLADVPPPLDLPCRRAAQAPVADIAAARFKWGVNPDTSQRLNEVARGEHATFYTGRLAVLVAHLAVETGGNNVVVGSYMSIRNRIALQDMFGPFMNLVTLRFVFEPHRSFRAWLPIVRDRVVATQAHSELPYEQLCDTLRHGGVTMPDIRLIFATNDRRPQRMADITISAMDQPPNSMPWGITVSMNEYDEAHRCELDFDAVQYDSILMKKFVDRFGRRLDALALQPDRPMGEVLAGLA